MIAVSVTVVASLSKDMPALTGVTGMANTTLYGTVTAVSYNGLNLMTVLPLVLIAVAILAAIVGSFMFLRGSGACE